MSDNSIYLSMGILNALNADNWSWLTGYPIKIYPFISSNFPLWFIWGIIYFNDKSSRGGVFGL